MNPPSPIHDVVAAAVSHICAGGIVVLPADTVYGIFGSVRSRQAVERVYDVKGRKRGKPFGVVTTKEKIGDVASLNERIRTLVGTLWPSAVSLIVPKNGDAIPPFFSDDPGLLVVCAENPILSAVVNACPEPIFSTTCNFAGEPEIKTIAGLDPFRPLVDLVVENHLFEFKGVPSTIVNAMGDPPQVIREGAVSVDKIRTVLPEAVKNTGLLIQ